MTNKEELKILALASQLGLSSMYDASKDTYSNWRTKVLTFAQQLLNEKQNEIVRPNNNH